MYGYWRQEQLSRIRDEEEVLIIRSDKRNFRVRPSQVLYIEGLGNYVTFYLKGKKPIISYQKLKELETLLPSQFYRVHKSLLIALGTIV
jgi:DNA-binding LytR/AlgR family response regulator